MIISLIAAMATNRTIGKDNQMPWHLPADLAHFKKVTLGKPVIMGRLTYESIGRPLPGRLNIVVSRNPELQIDGVETVTSIEQALALVAGEAEVMIIGGANIYQQCLARADRLYLTHIDVELEGDAHFPDYTQFSWQELEREVYPADERNQYQLSFVTLERS